MTPQVPQTWSKMAKNGQKQSKITFFTTPTWQPPLNKNELSKKLLGLLE